MNSAPTSVAAARRTALVGTLEVVTAASLWGTAGIFSVLLFRRGVSAVDVAVFRPLTATGFLVAWAVVRNRRALWPGTRSVLVLWTVGGGVTALFQLAYQMSTEALGVPATVGILYLAPLLVMVAGGPLLGEPPTLRQVTWGFVAVAGVWAVVIGGPDLGGSAGWRGFAWGFLTALGYAGYTLFGRWSGRRWSALTSVLHCYLGASLLLLAILPRFQGPLTWPAAADSRVLLAAYGFFTITVAVLLFYDALRRISAARASVTATVEPVVAATLAALILGQGLTAFGWAGLALVVAGVAGASWRAPLRPPATPS